MVITEAHGTFTFSTPEQSAAFQHDYENNGSAEAVRKHAPLASSHSMVLSDAMLRDGTGRTVQQRLEDAGFMFEIIEYVGLPAPVGRLVIERSGKTTTFTQEPTCNE